MRGLPSDGCLGSIPTLARHSRSRTQCALRSGIKEEAASAAGGQPRSRAHCVREQSDDYLPNSAPSSSARVCAATRAFSNSAFMSDASIDVMAA